MSNGNRTEWSPIQPVIIRVMTKSENQAAGVRLPINHKNYTIREKKNSLFMKEREILQ